MTSGAHILIHTATPYIYTAPDPQRDIVDPAIKGTVDAINASIENGLKRVIICSSGGAAAGLPVSDGTVVTEKVQLVILAWHIIVSNIFQRAGTKLRR